MKNKYAHSFNSAVMLAKRARALYPPGHMRIVWTRNMIFLISQGKYILQGDKKWDPS